MSQALLSESGGCRVGFRITNWVVYSDFVQAKYSQHLKENDNEKPIQ